MDAETTQVIALTTIDSSQINAIGYSEATQTLAIQFKNWKGEIGATYHYADVPLDVFNAFNEAESKGRYFGANIKPFDKKYPYVKVAEAPAKTS